MIQFHLMLLSSFLSAPVYAQVRIAAPTSGALAWSGPIAAVANEIGTGGVKQLDALSLLRLTAPDAHGRAPMLTSPELLNPLAQTLADSFVDPVEFPSMPMEFKATILRTAALLTEERLAMKVWAVVLDTQKGISRSKYAETANEARQARHMSLYLNDRTLEGLEVLEQRVKGFEKARDEAMRAFMDDLPAKIAAGGFDAKTLLRAEHDGDRTVWLDAAGNPEMTSDSPERVIDLRLGALGQIPSGPWTAAEVDLLSGALRAHMEGGTVSPSRWTNALRDRLLTLEQRSKETATTGPLKKALTHFSGNGRVTAYDARAIDAFYRNALETSEWNWALQARVLAAIHKGGIGFPSWERLQAAKEKLASRADFMSTVLVFASVAGSLGAAVATLFGYFSGISSVGVLGVMGILLLPLLVSIFFFDDRSLAKKSRLSDLMNRHFKKI